MRESKPFLNLEPSDDEGEKASTSQRKGDETIVGHLLDSFPLPLSAFGALSVEDRKRGKSVESRAKVERKRGHSRKDEGKSFFDPFDSD